MTDMEFQEMASAGRDLANTHHATSRSEPELWKLNAYMVAVAAGVGAEPTPALVAVFTTALRAAHALGEFSMIAGAKGDGDG